ncbi:hypothetical protein [Tessaracoccus oleiagri]|uniref:Uncharacterized protein n=1 Tax=Tessaracoccus oleiagri TaxID=686624 RepID=A0A1G9LUX4_9ACTN|nr:hypothetical protein [Tessaracoccus oleiagri]SDL65748.1 hypothetical protein SAMN04488242_2345 [Tessaracoccus oleiagri]
MLTTNTSVLTRRVRIDDDYVTLPYEAGWASEAVFFVQVEGAHPDLRLTAEVSPDGINWLPRGASVVMAESVAMAEVPMMNFGNWLRLTIIGATAAAGARVLVHLNLKG